MSANFTNIEINVGRNNIKVLCAMSGGVDSSVAAALLKEQGYGVIGITMQIWPSKKSFGGCCSLEAVSDAQKVAAALNIPHYVLNFRDVFRREVIDNFIAEYRAGRTPNPCIRCNQFIKFDHLLHKAKELGCDYIATGHYARKMTNDKCQMTNEGTKYLLYKGKDTRKDQSYVLYMLNQETLSKTLFPLGDWTKDKVREKAKELGLPVHDKEESQEICFVEDDNYVRFIKENCPEAVKPGKIIDNKGNVVGEHEGIAFYTLGQRKGIGHHKGLPKYVVKIDAFNNTVVIGDEKDTKALDLIAGQVTYVSGQAPAEPFDIAAKIRYNSKEAPATLYPLADGQVRVVFKEAQRSITPGQSVVFYQGEEVLGGGIISNNVTS